MLPEIYDYLDYRRFLLDVFEGLKQSGKVGSYRAFARLADSHSPDFLQRIRDRRLNVTPAEVTYLSRTLKLSIRRRLYFEALVLFDQATTHEEKEWHFQKILLAREYKSIKRLDTAKYRYFSHWYVPVVREMMTHPEYPDDPAWIARRMVPRIATGKVARAVRLLKTLDMVRRDAVTGRYVLHQRVLSTPSEVASLAVARYHRDCIALGQEALDRFPADQRDIRSVTLGVSKDAYPEIKQRMEAFWRELLSYANQHSTAERVYQVNMQVFPVTES